MKIVIRVILFSLFLLATVSTGLFIGENFRKDQPENMIIDHQSFHKMLHLTPDQLKKLSPIEKKFSKQKAFYENKIRLANIELGEVMKQEKAYTPKVQLAAEKAHKIMGQLQKITLIHFYNMRAILGNKQALSFDNYVAEALHGL